MPHRCDAGFMLLCYTDIHALYHTTRMRCVTQSYVLLFLVLPRASVTPKNRFRPCASVSQVLVFVAYTPCDIHCVTKYIPHNITPNVCWTNIGQHFSDKPLLFLPSISVKQCCTDLGPKPEVPCVRDFGTGPRLALAGTLESRDGP